MAENNGPVKLPDSLVLMRQWMSAEGREIFAAWLEGRVAPEVRQAALGQAKHPDLPRSARGGRVAKLINNTGMAWAASLVLAMCTFAYIAWDSRQDAALAKAQAEQHQEAVDQLLGLRLAFLDKVKGAADKNHWAEMVNWISVTRELIEGQPGTPVGIITDAWMEMAVAVYGEDTNLDGLHQSLKELERGN